MLDLSMLFVLNSVKRSMVILNNILNIERNMAKFVTF
jgi:hypothetical protein